MLALGRPAPCSLSLSLPAASLCKLLHTTLSLPFSITSCPHLTNSHPTASYGTPYHVPSFPTAMQAPQGLPSDFRLATECTESAVHCPQLPLPL